MKSVYRSVQRFDYASYVLGRPTSGCPLTVRSTRAVPVVRSRIRRKSICERQRSLFFCEMKIEPLKSFGITEKRML